MTYIGSLMDTLRTIKDILLSMNSKDSTDVENKVNEIISLIKKLNV